MLSQIERSFPQSLTKLIRPLEHCNLRTLSWLNGLRSLNQSCFKLELNQRGLLVQSLMKFLTFINLLLIESIWGMISLLLILLLLVLLCLSHLLIMLILRTIIAELIQLVRTQTKANQFQEHPLNLKRKRLETLGLRKVITKSLNRRSSISVITVKLQGIHIQITTSGQPLNKEIVRSNLETKISFHSLLLLLEIFLRPLYSFRT